MSNENFKLTKTLHSALRYMQKRRYSELASLGLHELLAYRQQVDLPSNDTSATQVGRELSKWLASQIERMHPDGAFDGHDVDWRHYTILKTHFLKDATVMEAAREIYVARAQFFDLQNSAIKALADLVWADEQAAKTGEKVLTNIEENDRRFPETYVPRISDNGIENTDVLVNLIRGGKQGIIALKAGPEVGKSRTAYEVARRCVVERLCAAVLMVQIDKLAHDYARDSEAMPYGRFAPLTQILNFIGDCLGKRNVREIEAIEEKSNVIYAAMAQKRPTLLILDGLDWINPADEPILGTFLANMPSPSIAIVVCRFAPQFDALPFELHGMRWAEAVAWMRNEAQRLIMITPSEDDMHLIYEHSGHGVPTAMRYWIRQMKNRGQPASDVVADPDIVTMQDDTDFEQSFSHILDESYARLYQRDPESLRLLQVLTIFTSPADTKSIGAAVGIGPRETTTRLGLLNRASLLEMRDGRYELLDIARKCLLTRRDRRFSDGASLFQVIDDAQRRLAEYYTNEFKDRLIGAQIKFLGVEKLTILGVLKWCDLNNHHEELIGLVDAIGRPLGIIGKLPEKLEWGERAMAACEQTGKPYWRDWFGSHDVAWTQSRTGHRDKALQLWMGSLANAEASEHPKYRGVKALAMRNLAQDLIRNKPDVENWEHAVEQLKQSIGIWEEIQEWEWAGHTLEVLGMAYFDREAYEQALPYLQKANEYLRSEEHTDGTISTLMEIACVMIKTGYENEALQFSEKAIDQARAMEQPAPALAYALWRRAQIAVWQEEPKRQVVSLAEEALKIYDACFASPWAKEAKQWLEKYLLQSEQMRLSSRSRGKAD